MTNDTHAKPPEPPDANPTPDATKKADYERDANDARQLDRPSIVTGGRFARERREKPTRR